jgi:hypothetical protein
MRGRRQSLLHGVSMTVGNGITIAVVWLARQPEEASHDDF